MWKSFILRPQLPSGGQMDSGRACWTWHSCTHSAAFLGPHGVIGMRERSPVRRWTPLQVAPSVRPRRANQASKGSAVYTACTSYPSHSFSPIPAPQRLCWLYSPCIPLRSIRSLTQYWAVLKPNAVSLCQHTPGSSAMPQCGTPGLTPPPPWAL